MGPQTKAPWPAWKPGVVRPSPPIPFRSTQQRTRNHDALNLVRALIDLGYLRVSHHSFDRVVRDVSVTAEDLHAVGRDLHRHVGGEELGHGRDLGEVRRL